MLELRSRKQFASLFLLWILTIIARSEAAAKAVLDNETNATELANKSFISETDKKESDVKSNATDTTGSATVEIKTPLFSVVRANGTSADQNVTSADQNVTSAATSTSNRPLAINHTDSDSNETIAIDTVANSTASNATTETPSVAPECETVENSYFILPIYVVVCVYSFLGIALTCHKYFLPSLGRICEVMRMSEDVVGATFMAAGSSAPELATVLIAVFVTKNDIGISDVIGSALFNLLFVIALCCFLTSTVVCLNWWPLCRNCFFYALSVLVLLMAIHDGKVNWFESVVLLMVYVVYCVALYYNVLLEAWVYSLPLPFNKLIADESTKQVDANSIPLQVTKQAAYDTTNTTMSVDDNVFNSTEGVLNATNGTGITKEDDDDDDGLSPNANVMQKIKWYTLYPIYFLCRNTIPNCHKKQFQNWFIITFFMSLIWISVYSYILVQMITGIGATLHITETVMGLTLLAAGVSVPDAITSINVVRKGYGDMGISNAVGSNIFDILVCLGLPWFLKTVVVNPGEYVNVQSIGMSYSTLLLFSSIALLIVTAYLNRWTMNKIFGSVLMIGYVIFIGTAITLEMMKGKAPECS